MDPSSSNYTLLSWLPEFVLLAFYAFLIQFARRRLAEELAGTESRPALLRLERPIAFPRDMTLLPIIERELRVRARRRAGYWTRFGVALGGVLICLPQLLFSLPFGASGTFGKGIFDSLVAAAFLLSCSACLLTAEAITAEQKEGTLGLLFLTRVKALDVLLGKLGSVGLTSLCGLLAFLPIMMIPILAGGVTGGEAFRKGLALLTMLCLALAVGLWAATSGRKSGIVRNAVGVLLLVVFVPFCFW